jgi:para-nitrobenzyl esterase
VICTAQGAVRGVVEGDMLAFKGIPYAAPPLGPLRWRPPQPPESWTGIRDGGQFGPVCPQVQAGKVVGEEDCLTLNIWTPARRAGDVVPVMVYLTGGGNHSQSGQGTGGTVFSGIRLVPEGVLVVTLNIRLGVLGFLTHPVLDAERSERVSGNYGNLDHIAVLRWLQANIHAFGGDPNRVFLFGTSAGGANICGLLTSPLAEGLFHGASMQSSVPTGCEFQTLAQAQSRTGALLAKAVNCATAECLRNTSAEELVLAVRAVTNLFPRTYGPVVDGYVFPDQPIERIRLGHAAKVPVIIGNTADETLGWVASMTPSVTDAASLATAVERVFGTENRARILAEYPMASHPTARVAFIRATTDALFTCQSRRVAMAIVEGGSGSVYRYVFTHREENGSEEGVDHTEEIRYLFTRRDYVEGESDRRTSQQLVAAWTQMAKTGRPSPAEAGWPAVRPQDVRYLEIGAERFPRGSADAHCEFWDSVELPSPHL